MMANKTINQEEIEEMIRDHEEMISEMKTKAAEASFFGGTFDFESACKADSRRLNLKDYYLSGLDIGGDLEYAVFENCEFKDVYFEDEEISLQNASMTHCLFIDCELCSEIRYEDSDVVTSDCVFTSTSHRL